MGFNSNSDSGLFIFLFSLIRFQIVKISFFLNYHSLIFLFMVWEKIIGIHLINMAFWILITCIFNINSYLI